MRRWLIAILIGIALLLGYEASRVWYISITVREIARSTLDRGIVDKRLRQLRLPDPPHVWPDTIAFVKGALIKKAIELEIALGEEDIAIWHDNRHIYCRLAWYQDLTFLAFKLGSVLLDFTEEVPIR
jgi:hypothetical protein